MGAKSSLRAVALREDTERSALVSRWALFLSRLTPPVERTTDIVREELLGLLTNVSGRLISVIAPAGYGKTTLLGQYVRTTSGPSAWLRVGMDCNEPTTLGRYVTVALDEVASIPVDLLRELDGVRPRSRVFTAALAASVREAPPFTFVLDDVHLLYDRRSIDLLRSLLPEVPQGSHIVLAARPETSFPLANVRTQGDLFEIGVEELRFEVDDAGALLRNVGVADISNEEVASLTEATEGWAVGLYLAARSGLADGRAPAPSIRGGDRHVADYLREAMLADLPADEVDFLVQTSVLEELTGPLCDAALAITGSGATLRTLEGSNLLVVPLDHQRKRYRYHHLFRDTLRAELESRSPELIGPITARASAWCEEQGSPEVAVWYAMAGRHVDRAADLMARYSQPAYQGGRAGLVRTWFEWLEAHAPIERYPAVAVLGTWVAMLEGRAIEAERWADAALNDREAPLDGEFEGARSLASALMCRDGIEQMTADAEHGLTLIERWSGFRVTALFVSGLAALARGDSEQVGGWFEQTIGAAEETGAGIAWPLAHAEMALLVLEGGDVEDASSHAAEARRIIEDGSLGSYPLTALSHAVMARIKLLQGDPVRARAWIDEAVSIGAGLTYALPTLAVQAKVLLAQSAMGLADLALAERFIVDADEVIRHRPRLGVLPAQLEAARAELAVLRARGMPSLTQAEARLLPLLKTHLSFREIGEQLFISPHTVKTQAISIYRKLGATSRGEAVEAAREIGLLTP
jgi:LuxR family transcriptional regulator, maltose regulon positive regulatory protein